MGITDNDEKTAEQKRSVCLSGNKDNNTLLSSLVITVDDFCKKGESEGTSSLGTPTTGTMKIEPFDK